MRQVILKRPHVTIRGFEMYLQFDKDARMGPLAESLKGVTLVAEPDGVTFTYCRGYAKFVFRKAGRRTAMGSGVGRYALIAVVPDTVSSSSNNEGPTCSPRS